MSVTFTEIQSDYLKYLHFAYIYHRLDINLEDEDARTEDSSVTSALDICNLVHSLSPGSVSSRLTTAETLSSSSGS